MDSRRNGYGTLFALARRRMHRGCALSLVNAHGGCRIGSDPVTTKPRRRQVSEQQRARAELRAVARPHRYRVRRDAEGFPLIPGRYGQIEWFDGHDLAVSTNHPRLFQKLWAIPGVRRHQTGDAEMRAVFPPEAAEPVAMAIRAQRRRRLSSDTARRLGSKTAYRATSRTLERCSGARTT